MPTSKNPWWNNYSYSPISPEEFEKAMSEAFNKCEKLPRPAMFEDDIDLDPYIEVSDPLVEQRERIVNDVLDAVDEYLKSNTFHSLVKLIVEMYDDE